MSPRGSPSSRGLFHGTAVTLCAIRGLVTEDNFGGFGATTQHAVCGAAECVTDRGAAAIALLARVAHWLDDPSLHTMLVMQVISPRVYEYDRRAVIIGTLVGAVLLVGGLSIGWLAFATPFIQAFTPAGRPGTSQIIAGMLAWAFALIAPATFIIVGVARIVTVVDSVSALRPKPTPASRLARVLGEEYVVASRVRLPDGRIVPEMIIGPFGLAVLEELPPAEATRHHNQQWEVRTREGRWISISNPLEKASRDADRVRRWLGGDEQDFVVKVYAAVISDDASLPRIPTCAVITVDQIQAWLTALPPQRSLNETRREKLVSMVRELA
jgi:hypothetical protein